MTFFTSFQPSSTGSLQLGNILGALLPFKKLIKENPQEDSYLSIASLHATTQKFNPQTLQNSRKEMLACFYACGLFEFPNLSIFDQSDNLNLGELNTLISHVASLGPLEIMTQFKEKGRDNNREEIPFGLLSYPILMTADILSLQANLIPVGQDQNQHIQLARFLIKRVNKRFGTQFIIPQAIIQKTPKIMDLKYPERKMSKSQPNGALFLEESFDIITKKIMKATTDSSNIPETIEEITKKPSCFNLICLYSTLSEKTLEESSALFSGQGYQKLKHAILEAYEATILPIANKLPEARDFIATKEFKDLFPNAQKAFEKTEKTTKELKNAMGLGSFK